MLTKFPVSTEETQFESMDDFLKWKEDTERESMAEFVLNCVSNETLEIRVCYYYCKRMGTYRYKGSGKRQLKSQGSVKMDTQCSAHMRMSENLQTKRIHVKYCLFHYNHQPRLAFFSIPPAVRQIIASKLKEGVAMDDIRDNIDGNLNREHLVNRQDIRNIKNQYNIEGIQKHSNDLISVATWVEEIQSHDEFTVPVFKAQGIEQPGNFDNFSEMGFHPMLANNLSTRYAKKIWQQYHLYRFYTWYEHVRFLFDYRSRG